MHPRASAHPLSCRMPGGFFLTIAVLLPLLASPVVQAGVGGGTEEYREKKRKCQPEPPPP